MRIVNEQLELLWKLQTHDTNLEKYKNSLEELAKKGHVENITLRMKNIEKRLQDRKNQLEETETRVKKNSNILDQLNYELNDIEKSLYNGSITDLKQLNYMDTESKKIKEMINKEEFNILKLMEDIDELKKDINKIEKDYNETRLKLEEDIEKYKLTVNNIRNKVREEMEIIYDLTYKIDKKLLSEYKELKKNKGTAVSAVSNGECIGCHMLIPTFILDKLKKKSEIIYCENCGRILYYVKESEKDD